MDLNVENGIQKKVFDIQTGDMFEYQDNINVAISNGKYGYIWITNKETYMTNKLKLWLYGYTNCCIMYINPSSNVRIIKNLNEK